VIGGVARLYVLIQLLIVSRSVLESMVRPFSLDCLDFFRVMGYFFFFFVGLSLRSIVLCVVVE